MTSLRDRMKSGASPNVGKLFARSQNARTVMSGPAMMQVMGLNHRSGSVLKGFASGLGALPAFTSGDVGLAQNVLNQVRNDISTAQVRAKQVQADAAPAMQRPEGAQLRATAQALENSIASAWDGLLVFVNTYGQRLAAEDAARNTNTYSYQRNGFTISWQGAPNENFFASKGFTRADYYVANDAYLAEVQNATARSADSAKYIASSKQSVINLLNKYANDVAVAASLVKDAVEAEIRAKTAETQLNTAKNDSTSISTSTLTFVAQQQLDQLKQAADLAKKRAERAANMVSEGTGIPKWLMVVGGVAVVGVGVYLLKKRG